MRDIYFPATIGILRSMTWQRAKGELQSIRYSYHSGLCGNEEGEKFERFSKALEAFIREVEDNGLTE